MKYKFRSLIVVIHRYVGLSLASFLFVAALSGSILSFNHELEELINPELFIVPIPKPFQKKLDPLLLHEKVKVAFPNISTDYIPLRSLAPEKSFSISVHSATNDPIDFDQVFLDPYTGRVLGTRMRGDLSQGFKNIMPFIYKLHYSLLLGDIGELIFGIIALIWTLDILFVTYLTFPLNTSKRDIWIIRWWKHSWHIKLSDFKSLKRFVNLHKSIGLWILPILFIFAWSSVYFNLGSIYKPVMHILFEYQHLNMNAKNLSTNPKLDWYEAREIGRKLMLEESIKYGFKINYEDFIGYFPKRDMYEYFVNSDRDIFQNEGKTRIYLDKNTGKLLSIRIPTGQASSDTITSWITAFHMAAIGNVWFKVFIALMGGIIVLLIFTGVFMWWRKRH